MNEPIRYMNSRRHQQEGGVTILVAFSLLTLLTVAAFTMSRGSLREAAITGSTRMASDVQQVSDAGLDWSLVWMDSDNASKAPDPNVGAGLLVKAVAQCKRLLPVSGVSPLPTSRVGERGFSLPTSGEIATGGMRLQKDTDGLDNKEKKFNLVVSMHGRIKDTESANQLPPEYSVWFVRSTGQVTFQGGSPSVASTKEMLVTLPLSQ